MAAVVIVAAGAGFSATAPAYSYAPLSAEPDRPPSAQGEPMPFLMRPTTGVKSGLPAGAGAPRPVPVGGDDGIGDDGDGREGGPGLEGGPGRFDAGPPGAGIGDGIGDSEGDGDSDPDAGTGAMVAYPPSEGRAAVADIRYGADSLPPTVAERRRRLIEAARTGDIEALRTVFETQAGPPVVSVTGEADDLVGFLRQQSGDEEGREILAILIELLESGHVAVGEGPARTFVWPYFAEVPLQDLDARHYVEVYRVLTAVDVEEMLREGRYLFFRVGITEDGRLRYFTAGDIE